MDLGKKSDFLNEMQGFSGGGGGGGGGGEGPRGMFPREIVLNFNSLKSPFQGF